MKRKEIIQLAKTLKDKGGVGSKFVKLSGQKDDALYRGLRKSKSILKRI